jgi:hypothetical protein
MTGDKIDPRGPVFVSHRHLDGAKTAAGMAWLLRAGGVPVWHDQGDLPPGDTNERLAEALASGLSGGVLLVTPDLARSNVVRTVEAPKLLELEKDPAFVLAVGNTVRLPNGDLDYNAPDDLLGMPRGTLGRLKQHGADTPDGLVKIAREIVLHRVARLASLAGSAGEGVLQVSVQTRAVRTRTTATPQTSASGTVLRPPGGSPRATASRTSGRPCRCCQKPSRCGRRRPSG